MRSMLGVGWRASAEESDIDINYSDCLLLHCSANSVGVETTLHGSKINQHISLQQILLCVCKLDTDQCRSFSRKVEDVPTVNHREGGTP